MSRVVKSDKLKTKYSEPNALKTDGNPDKKESLKKQTTSRTPRTSTNLKEKKSENVGGEQTSKQKLRNVSNGTTKNTAVVLRRKPDQRVSHESSQAEKRSTRIVGTSSQDKHVSSRAKSSTKNTTIPQKPAQKFSTSKLSLNSAADKKRSVQKKNSVLDTPHNVTVSSPPSQRKYDPKKVENYTTERADTKTLTRKGSRTLAPDEILVLKRDSAKLRSEKAIRNENLQTAQTRTTAVKDPVAFEVKFEERDKKKITEMLPVEGKNKSDEENNYSDDFESYESDFETGSSTDSLSTSATVSLEIQGVSKAKTVLENREEVGEEEMSLSNLTSDEDELKAETEITQKPNSENQANKERKLDSGHFDISSRRSNTVSTSDSIVPSSQISTDSWETSFGTSEQLDSGISACTTILPSSKDERSIEVVYGGYRYFYERPIINGRGSELKNKIQFDVLSFTFLDLKPISYEVFMQTYGEINTTQNFTQTQENEVNAEQQTEIQETRSFWTQHPPQFVFENRENCDRKVKYFQLSCGEIMENDKTPLGSFCELEGNLNAIKQLNSKSSAREYQRYRHQQKVPLNYQHLSSFLMRSSFLLDQILGSSHTNPKNSLMLRAEEDNNQVLKQVCEKSFYMKTNLLNSLRVIKIFANNKFNLLITVHESLPDTNVYSSDFSNLLMVWCTTTCNKPLRLLTTWSEVSKVEISNDSCDIVVAALRDGSVALWDLRETYSFCSKLDGYLTHFAATHSIIPSYMGEDGKRELEIDLGACLDVKSFKSPPNNMLIQTSCPKTQFVSLHDSGIVTVWTLIQTTAATNFDFAHTDQSEKHKISSNLTEMFDSISPWARVKLAQSSIVNIKKYTETKSAHFQSNFEKTKDLFQKNIYSDEFLRELNASTAEFAQQGIRFTSLECGSENLFICTNRNFILMCSKTLKMDKLKRISIGDSQFLFPTALKVFNNEHFLAAGLSNGEVIIFNCQSNKVAQSSNELLQKTETSKVPRNFRANDLGNSPTSKSCAIQNILLNVQKSCEEMDHSQDYRPSTAACITLIDSKRKPFELRVLDQQIIMSGSALRRNLIQLLELSSDGWYLFALANGHVRVYDFYLEKELDSEEPSESQPGKVIGLATGKCGGKENNLMILRPNTEVEVIILK